MLEILISVTIISLSCLPIFYMASYNMETTRLDRVRLEAESICHNTLERFGQSQDKVAEVLKPVPGDPTLRTGNNIHLLLADLYKPPAHLGLDFLITQHDFRMDVELKQGVSPGLDQLTVVATWWSDREHRKKREKIAYARFIIYDHYH